MLTLNTNILKKKLKLQIFPVITLTVKGLLNVDGKALVMISPNKIP